MFDPTFMDKLKNISIIVGLIYPVVKFIWGLYIFFMYRSSKTANNKFTKWLVFYINARQIPSEKELWELKQNLSEHYNINKLNIKPVKDLWYKAYIKFMQNEKNSIEVRKKCKLWFNLPNIKNTVESLKTSEYETYCKYWKSYIGLPSHIKVFLKPLLCMFAIYFFIIFIIMEVHYNTAMNGYYFSDIVRAIIIFSFKYIIAGSLIGLYIIPVFSHPKAFIRIYVKPFFSNFGKTKGQH